MIGKQGAERAFEILLHGRAGQRDLEVTKANTIKDVAREKAPKRGTDIFLSLDMGAQDLAHRLLGGRPGAIVISVLEPGHEGELLALASSPTYDPSRLNDIAYVERLNRDPNKPFANRAYALTAPPGSTFKIVTTQTALQSEAITTGGYRSYCRGYTEIGEQRYNCHHEEGHGSLNLIQSFAESCDVAYYDISTHRIKGDVPGKLKHYAELFGYGAPTGIELPGEVSGLLPDKDWKRRTYDKPQFNKWDRMWFDGNTANYAIGQGDLLATPLQVLWSANTVALDGRVYKPRLLIATRADGSTSPTEAESGRNVPLDKDALAFVRQAMRYTVTNGTCRKLNISGMQVCAKSGTAEAGRGKSDHSWVVGFYPMDRPRFGFVAFYQNGGSAGEAAIPAMREMLMYLKNNDPFKELDRQRQNDSALSASAN
jgi:penicillin-binding protein 2